MSIDNNCYIFFYTNHLFCKNGNTEHLKRLSLFTDKSNGACSLTALRKTQEKALQGRQVEWKRTYTHRERQREYLATKTTVVYGLQKPIGPSFPCTKRGCSSGKEVLFFLTSWELCKALTNKKEERIIVASLFYKTVEEQFAMAWKGRQRHFLKSSFHLLFISLKFHSLILPNLGD